MLVAATAMSAPRAVNHSPATVGALVVSSWWVSSTNPANRRLAAQLPRGQLVTPERLRVRPRPRTNRPSLTASNASAAFAVVTGCRKFGAVTMVPTPMREVTAAAASVVSASCHTCRPANTT